MINFVKKKNGTIEPFQPEKLNRWAKWADHYGVLWSTIALETYRRCYDGCSTTELHKAMIDACCAKEEGAYLQMAGHLLMSSIYKETFGGHKNIPSLAAFYESMVRHNRWAKMDYDTEEIDRLNALIVHDKDFSYGYTALRQMYDKYLISDRVENRCFETPQFMFMGMAMAAMERQPKDRRLDDITKLYGFLSDLKLNTPTPFLVNLRTPHRGYASCCVYTTADSAKSLATGDHIAYLMTCSSAGIGAHLKTRSKGDPIRGGLIKHMGKLGYIRMLDKAVHANLQNSRGGAATLHFNVLDPEIEDLIILKNPTTPDQKRIRDIDYSVGVNAFFSKKVARNENWMCISYYYAPDLYEAFYSSDLANFQRLYAKYEGDSSIPKTFISARKLALKILTESVETGRIYLHWCDEMNRHTPFKETIYSSNLCQEIALPTKAFPDVLDLYRKDSEGEIGLCLLASLVLGRIDEDEYEEIAYYTLLLLDSVIDLMEYPFGSLETSTKARRSVGVGLTNLAYFLAKKGLTYSSVEGKNCVHRLAETHSYFLHRASLRLAKERGVCQWIGRTTYAEGWLPIDSYNRNVDSCHGETLHRDWETLRREIIQLGGLRNSVLEAFMPNESSSQTTNTTNSIYPIRSHKMIKTSGNNKNILIAPESDALRNQYQLAWDVPTKDLIDLYAIFQKFTGQAISADIYIDYSKSAGKISERTLLTDFLYMTKMGMKTRYYINSKTDVHSRMEDENLQTRAADVENDDDVRCSTGSCTL